MPRFTENESNDKNAPLTREAVEAHQCEAIVLAVLGRAAASLKEQRPLRVLDFGCGRGLVTGALRRQGFACYGVDVEQIYVDNARSYFGEVGNDDVRYPIVSLLDQAGRSVFPDGHFDVIISDQVLEHVRDVDLVAAEIGRLTSASGTGLHIFPSHLSLIEPHMKLPLVHWLPKGPARRRLIRSLLATGLGARYFSDLGLGDRAQIFSEFSESETFYRSEQELRAAFGRAGLECTVSVREKLRLRGGTAKIVAGLPVIGAAAAWTYGTFWQTYLETHRR
jgi:2-polyprenyl-3-methyl-5-hydroxy-6-metoxy-1,4-benzoquinol methylase